MLGVVIAVGESDNVAESFLLDAFRTGFWALAVLAVLCQAELLLRVARRRRMPLPTGQPVPRWFVLVTQRRESMRHGDAHFTVGTERAPRRARRPRGQR
jgi:hypothetical protein